MKPCVIDASVVAALLFREEHADAARVVLLSGRDLHAPDLIHAELANVIWKRHRRGEVSDEAAYALLVSFRRMPLLITPSVGLVDRALRIAMHTGRTPYDCLYIALAMKTRAAMLTCDRRLVNALAGTWLEDHVMWLGEL